MVGDDRFLLVDEVLVGIQKFNGQPIGLLFPPIVEMVVASTEPGARGDTASGSVTRSRASRPGSRFACRCSSRTASA